jgi:hypothetical protein
LASESDDFLSAPESVRGSERERRKAAARKARLEAEEQRLAAQKSQARPSIEDMLNDLIRVAEDPETNPFHLFRTLSRKRYREFGHYPIHFIDEQWGRFELAKQVAGLEDQAGTRLCKAAIAERSVRDHAGRYLERHMLPHVRKHPELDRELVGAELMLSISDTHATFLDPFTWQVFLACCRDLQPGIVYLNGDIIDGSEISRHPKIPGWTIPLQLEFDFARVMFEQIRAVVGPDTRIVWGAGNHGLDRLAMYLTQVAPAFANLRNLRFDKLAGLDDLDIELAQGGTIASPEGREAESPGRLIHGFYRVHHGTHLGQYPAALEMREAGRSGQSGHVHRAHLYFGSNEADRTMSWMSTPMGCTPVAGRGYMKGICTGWQRGFGVAFLLPGGHVRQYPVITDDNVCVVEGYVYERPANLADPDPQKLWLKDLGGLP